MASKSTKGEILAKFFDDGEYTALFADGAVSAASGYAAGQQAYAVFQNGEAVSVKDVEKNIKVLELAAQTGCPVVTFYDSVGAKLAEGLDVLNAAAKLNATIAKVSGVVPQVAVVLGVCGGTSALSAANADVCIMAEGAELFFTAPFTAAAKGDKVADAGSAAAAAKAGVAAIVAADAAEAAEKAAQSEEVAKKLAPEETADAEIMLREQAGIVSGLAQSVMDAAFAAKRAALTVDLLVQNLSPHSNRGSEGAVTTRLYTNMEGMKGSKKIPCSIDGYSKEEAMEEAKRCIQCHCDECMKSCVYLSEYKKHPGLLAREIYNNTQIIMGDHQMNKPMNSCSLCGQCTVTCPNGFDMSQVCKSARENMVSTDKMPLAPHEFALMDMLFSNSEAFLCRPQPGYETCRYVFFPGCQAGAIAPDVVTEAYEDLCRRTEGGVALMLGCCGAISEWAGRYEMTEKVNEQLKQELAKLGDPMIIAGCPSCMKQLKESLGVRVTGIWEILKEIGLPAQAKGLEIPVAIHDACGARGDAQTQDIIRELLADMGCTVVNTEYSRDLSPCCGYGGLTSCANKEMADKMTEKCLERSDAPYITYCMACRDRFVREGRESRHILELLYGINAANMPDISEKRYNRLELKEKLLKNIWNEELMMEKKDYTVAYTEDAISMMDERMILKSDVERVLSDYRENQEAIFDEETKELVTRSRLGNVTFWVRFVETEDGYLVRRAYSHRMNIMKRVGQ